MCLYVSEKRNSGFPIELNKSDLLPSADGWGRYSGIGSASPPVAPVAWLDALSTLTSGGIAVGGWGAGRDGGGSLGAASKGVFNRINH